MLWWPSHQGLDILGSVVHHGVSWLPVPAGAGALLVQRIHGLGYRVVDHKAHCTHEIQAHGDHY